MKLIIGLGNPGPQYERTRHNVGFHVVDSFAEKRGWRWNEQRDRAILASGMVGPEKVILAKPITFMNLSGEAVGALVRWYKVQPEDVLVVCDDLDLPVGRVRLKRQGSAGGQKGLDNIIRHLHTDAVPRLRVGIGRPANHRMDNVNYVLGAPGGDEGILLATGEARAIEGIDLFVRQGIDSTMNTINADPESEQRAAEKRQRQQERQEQARLKRAALQREKEEQARQASNPANPATDPSETSV